jgi:hypothetical protein
VQRLAGYPKWFFGALMAVMASLLGTAVALLPAMLEMRLDIATPWNIQGGMRLLAAALHCAAGFLFVGMAGALLAIHVRIGWRRKLNRISGTALLVLILLMLGSALGIYYLGDELSSRASSIIHTGAGLLATLFVAWHAIKGRQSRRDASVWKNTRTS